MRPRLIVVLAASLIVTLAVGCKRHGAGTSCDAAGAKFLALAHQDLDASKDLDPANRRGVVGLLAPMRDAMVRACREDGWSAEARACFAGAADVVQLRACDVKLTEPQRELLRKAASRGVQAKP